MNIQSTPAPNLARSRGNPDAIIVDCDGVMLNWIDGFRVFAERRLGRRLCAHGPLNFDLHEWLGLETVSQALDLIREFNAGADGYFGQLKPLPGAVEALKEFHAAGREIHVITAISLDPAVVSLRHENLDEVFGAIFSEIHCVGLRDSKSPILESYAQATWVEDKFENAVAGVQAGHQTYLIRSSHNAHREADGLMHGLHWVDGWAQIKDLEART